MALIFILTNKHGLKRAFGPYANMNAIKQTPDVPRALDGDAEVIVLEPSFTTEDLEKWYTQRED